MRLGDRGGVRCAWAMEEEVEAPGLLRRRRMCLGNVGGGRCVRPQTRGRMRRTVEEEANASIKSSWPEYKLGR